MNLEINTNSSTENVLPMFESVSLDGNEEIRKIGPIERQMKKTLSRIESDYPDTFDWSVYDRISDKFDETPRGGVVFNTTFKLVNHHASCTKCLYAFEIDAYGRGCVHNCEYCYAKDQLTTHGFWNRPQPFPINLAEVRKVFHNVFETDRKSRWRSIMEKRIPLRIGSMSDSFMWMDTKYGVTKELLKILNYYDYPYIIFTRSDLVAHDDYISLLNNKLCSVQMSISGNNTKFIRDVEPGAPNFRRRLKALTRLTEAGVWTTVRLNPLFPKYPDGYFTDPELIKSRYGDRKNVPTLPFYDDQIIAEIAESGTSSLLAGFVRLTSHTINNLGKATGVNFKEFFRPEIMSGRGDKNYSDAEIRYYYKWIAQECKKHSLRFSTCYIGNGVKDFYQYQDLWVNKKDCCDVIGNVEAFKTTSQEIPWEERVKFSKSPSIAEAGMKADSSYKATLDSKKTDVQNSDSGELTL